MKRFAVGFFSLHDTELVVEILEAETWQEAAMKHTRGAWGAENPVPADLEEAKRDAFDLDGGFDCVEIPS